MATRTVEGIHYITDEDRPLAIRSDDGGVLLSITDNLATKFRTPAAYENWLLDQLRSWMNP